MTDGAPTTPSADAARGYVHARVRRCLAQRVDSEHEQALVRMAIVSLLVVYFGALAILAPAATPLDAVDVALYGLGYLAIGGGYFGWILARPRPSPVRRILAMITDQTNVAVLIAVGGPWGGALYPIYLWITFGNGFRFGNAYLTAAAGYSLLTFVVAASLHPFWVENIPLTVGLALGLLGLPAYGADLIRRLTEAKRAAEAASHAKSRFLATMSHELRTPLNAVIGMSEMLRDGRLEPDQDDMAETINTSGRGLLTLINDILDHAKIESGNAKVAARDFDLTVEIANTLTIVRPQAKAKGLGLATVLDAEVPRRVNGDPACLRHILLNLLANALKFTETGGAVLRVGATPGPNGHELTFAVEDTGIGLAPENRTQIFETFTQSEQDRGRRHEGSGLGLAIARQLAELMGGDVSVESTPGAGSIFTLTLPVGPADAEEITGADGLAAPPNQPPDGAIELDLRTQSDAALTSTTDADLGSGAVAITDPAEPITVARAWKLDTVVRLVPPVTPARRRTAIALLDAMIEGAAEREADSEAEERSVVPATQPATVLVVEDNAVNLKVTAKILARAGHTPITADSGETALDHIEAGRIDAVLMDVNMPESSGLETTQLFRYTELGGSARLPIIALTADATEATRKACWEAGMDDFIAKPATPYTVLATLAAYLPSADEGVSDRNAASPEAADPTAEQPVLDAQAVATLRELDSDGCFLWETVETFLAEATTLLDDIATRLRHGDVAGARDELHALKSAAGNVGAARLRECIRDLDAHLAVDRSRTVDAAMAQLRREIDAYRDAISPHLSAPLGQGKAAAAVAAPMSQAGQATAMREITVLGDSQDIE